MNKQKKKVLIVVICLFAIAVVGFIMMKVGIFDSVGSSRSVSNKKVTSFVYNEETELVSWRKEPADFDADIFRDPDYLGVTSWLNYTRGTITIGLFDEDYESWDKNLALFDKYFDSLKSGDTDTLISLHSDRYFDNNWEWIDIAPQRVYDIYVEYIFDKDVNDPEYGKVTKYIYKLSYKIMKNDGTFRNDVGSDAAKPVYIELVEKPDGELFIDAQGNSVIYPEN